MVKVRATLICTIFNEEKNIESFIKSIAKQTVIPNEIIIVDGGSKDNTDVVLKRLIEKYANKLKIIFLQKMGNRSIGRNEAIKNSSNEIILCTDSGNLLDKNWVKEITRPFSNKRVEVVAGYYKGIGKTAFEKCMIPYALVMKERINKNNFLPATRSMAFKKNIWKKVGEFNEKFSHNEDYDFANKLKSRNAKIVFTDKAIVSWFPRRNLKQAFVMFFRFAFGDGESGNLREKVLYIFLRYFLLFYLLFLDYLYKSKILSIIISLGVVAYLSWSIAKNTKYINDSKKYFLLPLIQLTSDIAVMVGTSLGVIKRVINLDFKAVFLHNKGLFFILIVYILTVLSSITWGIPNQNHPFLYHMDEWHQLQSVRFVFQYGSPNFQASANGPMFHFFLSGIYLSPFVLLKIVNPFTIKSAIDAINMQHLIFIILRLNTLLFGVLTLLTIYKTSKILKIKSMLPIVLLAFTPVWIMLSNNFKYDIALTFWLTFSIYCFLRYFKNPIIHNLVLLCIVSALTLSVKVTGIPLIGLIIVSFFLFSNNPFNRIKDLVIGLISYFLIVIFFGIPDIIFNGKSIYEYLYSNLTLTANLSNYVKTGYSTFSFIMLHNFPTIFGHPLFLLFCLSLIYFLKLIRESVINKEKIYKFYLIILLYFIIFIFSFYPIINLGPSANRVLVILPAMVLIIAISVSEFIKNLSGNKKILVIFILFICIFLQIFETYCWVLLKHTPAPQETSSSWVLKNIKPYTTIGLENIPLYQKEPDIVLKEFYNKQYKTNLKLKYNYQIVDYNTKNLPEVIIVSDVKLSEESERNTSKINLINKLNKENYKIITTFSPALNFYYFFGNTFNFVSSGLIAYPGDITIFKKNNMQN